MTTFGLNIDQAKGLFLDTRKIINKTERANIGALTKGGARVRLRAKGHLRKRKGTSRPGGFPHGHVGKISHFLFYGIDRANMSVPIGPVRLNTPVNAPEKMEYGGLTTIVGGSRHGERVTVEPRPFMGPALQKELPNIPPLWRDSIY